MENDSSDSKVKRKKIKRASTNLASPKNQDFEGFNEPSTANVGGITQTLQPPRATTRIFKMPNDNARTVGSSLQVNSDELFMMSRFLSKDVKAPSDPRCLIDYAKNQDRDYYYDYIPGAHEGRFDNINKMPKTLTKFGKHVAAPSFQKVTKR